MKSVAAPAAVSFFVYDGRHEDAVTLAARYRQRMDCSSDAAQVWFRELVPALRPGCTIAGVTCAADWMVLQDLSRSHGLKPSAYQALPSGLMFWQLG